MNVTPESDENKTLEFTDTVIIYKDRDILQSFCINSVRLNIFLDFFLRLYRKDPSQVAMATTRGIREVTLNKEKKVILYEDNDSEVNDIYILITKT